ncbi:MAG: hypothetical protein ACP5P4_05910 [Steroidobacteraceae bacterium]
MLRAGRIGLSIHLLGDALDVGYAYRTVRPPPEVYGMLATEVSVTYAGAALVVFLVITDPIKRLSIELHRPRTSGSPALEVPSGNEAHEIGQLVADVKALLGNLDALV